MSTATPPGGAAPGQQPGQPGQREAGLRRLRAALAPRATRGQLVVGLLCLLLGLALVVQVRQRTGGDLAALPQAELLGLLDDATDRSDRLQREITDLRTASEQLRASGDRAAAARAQAQQRLDTLGILAGTAAATGPGVRVTVAVPEGQSGARLLLGAVQELRDAGAEAMQVSGVRVVASTSFTDAADGGVDVSGTEVRSPYAVLAIGGSQTLASAMEFPDGVGPTVRKAGGSVAVEPLARVDVTALRPSSGADYARPAEPAAAP